MPSPSPPTPIDDVTRAVARHRFADPAEWAQALAQLADLDEVQIERIAETLPVNGDPEGGQ